MYTYKKGYRSEKELIKLLSSLGFAVLRAPKSGTNTIDVLACKRGNIFAFECKSWSSTVRVKERQLNTLLNFSEKAGAIPLIAVKKEQEGWKFLKAEDLGKNNGTASEKLIEEKSFGIEFFSKY